MKISRILGILASVCLFASCASSGVSSNEPSWATNPELEYPEAKYIKAIGSGKTEELAKSTALSEISQYFRTNVQTETEAQSVMKQVSNNGNVSTSSEKTLDMVVKTSSETTLQGIKYTESYKSKKDGLIKVLAYIERDVAFRTTQTNIDNILQKFNSHLKMAKVLENSNPLKAIESYNFAKESTVELLVQLSFLTLIDSNNPEIQKYDNDKKNALSIDASISKCKRNCTIFIEINDDYKDEIKTYFAGKLKAAGFTVSPTIDSAVYSAKCDVNFNITGDKMFESNPSIDFSVILDGESMFNYSISERSRYNYQGDSIMIFGNNETDAQKKERRAMGYENLIDPREDSVKRKAALRLRTDLDKDFVLKL